MGSSVCNRKIIFKNVTKIYDVIIKNHCFKYGIISVKYKQKH